MTTNKPQRGLGRGLDALLPVAPPPSSNYGDKSVFSCGIEKIVPQKGQPRRHFEPQALAELAQSIKEHGLIEPVVVRRVGTGGTFEIIAGERRRQLILYFFVKRDPGRLGLRQDRGAFAG